MTDDFAQYVLQSNPFAANAVNDPSGAEVDVQSIHGRQFEELVRHAEEGIASGDISGRSSGASRGSARATSWPGCAVGPTGSRVLAASFSTTSSPTPNHFPAMSSSASFTG